MVDNHLAVAALHLAQFALITGLLAGSFQLRRQLEAVLENAPRAKSAPIRSPTTVVRSR